jgi:uncharacterized damage-inducible protein DinB
MKSYFKQLFDYDAWANLALLNKFEKQFPVNPRIYELYSHLIAAHRIWLDRCMGIPQSTALWPDSLPAEMQMDQEANYLDWLAFINQLNEGDFDKTVTYTNSKGDIFTNKLINIIAHTINHGTYHRGNLTILMKEEGFVLDNLDLITYIRK